MTMIDEQLKLSRSKEGLPSRLYNALLRNKFGSGQKELGSIPPLDRDRVRAAVDDGSILKCRLIGKRSVAILREWLGEDEQHGSVKRRIGTKGSGETMKPVTTNYVGQINFADLSVLEELILDHDVYVVNYDYICQNQKYSDAMFFMATDIDDVFAIASFFVETAANESHDAVSFEIVSVKKISQGPLYLVSPPQYPFGIEALKMLNAWSKAQDVIDEQ